MSKASYAQSAKVAWPLRVAQYVVTFISNQVQEIVNCTVEIFDVEGGTFCVSEFCCWF